MAEICFKCFKLENPFVEKEDLILDPDPDLCETCGTWQNEIVVRYTNKAIRRERKNEKKQTRNESM